MVDMVVELHQPDVGSQQQMTDWKIGNQIVCRVQDIKQWVAFLVLSHHHHQPTSSSDLTKWTDGILFYFYQNRWSSARSWIKWREIRMFSSFVVFTVLTPDQVTSKPTAKISSHSPVLSFSVDETKTTSCQMRIHVSLINLTGSVAVSGACVLTEKLAVITILRHETIVDIINHQAWFRVDTVNHKNSHTSLLVPVHELGTGKQYVFPRM